MRELRPFLVERRIFLMGGGMKCAEQTGKAYRDDQTVKIQPNIRIEPYTTYWSMSGRTLVSMGAFSYTHSVLPDEVSVGRYTSIAKGLRVMGASHPVDWLSTSPVFYNKRVMMRAYEEDRQVYSETQRFDSPKPPITIGNDVWIGENVTLARGLCIGDGAVVAANATVVADVEPYAVVGGLPARTIRARFPKKTVKDLLDSQWWHYAPETVACLDVRRPGDFARKLRGQAARGAVRPYMPEPATYEQFCSAIED